MKYLLDTNTCIHIMKRSAGLRPKAELVDCGISPIVQGELEYGLWKGGNLKRNRLALDDLLSDLRVVPFTEDVPACYGKVRAQLSARGHIIGSSDLWIAAHALAIGLPLVTHNLDEFARVPGLSVTTWMRV